MLDSVTRKRIDNCRDILVGKLPSPSAQVEQITIALIYKFMDDMDRVTVEEYGGNPTFFKGDFEKYSWQNIYSPRTDAHQMLNLYAEGIQKMGQNPGLNPMFRSIFKDAFLPYRDPETLRLFLSTINEFSYEHSEMLGDAFEYLLSIMGSQGDAGQFRTPRHIIDFLVELVDPKIGETILDPACGTSGFLISAYKHILNSNKKDKPGDLLSSSQKKELLESINGYDISPDMVRLSSANLFLHGFTDDELNIHEYDTLSSEDRWNEYYDVIIANPPFMTPKGGIRPHNRFSVDSNRAEVLFTNYIMEHLTPKGRAGIVVPEGIIFQSGKAYKQLRKALVEKYLIGVISLPSGVFNPYSGVKTSILILDKELSQKTDKIFFSKVENDGFDLGAQRRIIDKNDLPEIKKSTLEYINNLQEGGNKEHPDLTFVSKEEIINSNDIGLSSERYNIQHKFNDDIPFITIGEVCDVINGSTPKRSNEKYWNNGNIPWMTIEDIRKNGSKIHSTIQHITREALEETSIKILPKNSILISCTATIGEIAITKINLTTNQQFNGLVIKDEFNEKLNPEFLFWMCKNLKKFLLQLSGKTSFNFIAVSKLKELKIPIPSLEIQKEIVEELEQYQRIIDGARQVIDNYKPHIDIDEKWQEINLLDCCLKITDGSHFSPRTVPEGIPYITVKDLKQDFKIDFNNCKFITQTDYDILAKSGCKPEKNDILFSKDGTVGKTAIVEKDDDFVVLSSLAIITPNLNKVLPKYLFYLLSTEEFISKAINNKTGVAIKRIVLKNLKLIKVKLPPIQLQRKILNSLEIEKGFVDGNRRLIEIYAQKIEDRFNKIWGE